MIDSVQNFKAYSQVKLKKATNNSQTISPLSFKGGFERLENGIFRAGGISVWNKKTQHLISKSIGKEKLETLMKLLEETENKRILFCDIDRCGIFKNRLKAKFQSGYFINNFTEDFKQKIFESKWEFLIRMLKQFNKYKSQLLGTK